MDDRIAEEELEQRPVEGERRAAPLETERRYRVVSELTSDYAGALRVDPDGRMTAEWSTDAFARITGYTLEELAERGGIGSIVHPDDRAVFLERREKMRRGEPDVREFRIITRGGEVRWLRDHARPMTDDTKGGVVRWYVAAKDITAQKLAEMQGGRIGFESQEGVGSTFWFTARFEKQPDGAAGPGFAPEILRGRRILVVDDNATNRLVLREQLRSWGCLSVEASGGAEALSLLSETHTSEEPIAIAILDMEMPDMDGTTLGRRIREDPRLREVVLVMLTSRGRRGDAKLAEELGFAAYLTKPVRSTLLRDCLARVWISGALQRPAGVSAPAQPAPINSLTSRKHRILVAEDNITNQRMAVRILEKAGYRADAVANGREVLSALETAPYHLILMDVQMP